MYASGNAAQRKQCPDCERTFTRAEHLTRHRRTHTQEKPFACHLCSSTFPRADVRSRHLKNYHGVDVAASKPQKVACETCRRRKVRCNCEQTPSGFFATQGEPIIINDIVLGQDILDHPNDTAVPEIFTQDEIDPNSQTHLVDGALEFFDPSFTGDPGLGLFDAAHDLFPTPPFYLDFPWDDAYDPWSLDFCFTTDIAGNESLPPNVETARRLIEEYQEHRSGRNSPERQSHPQRWGSAAPRPQIYDDAVIDIFVGLAKIHLASTFRLIETFDLSEGMKDEVHLAIAAIGGLFCSVNGSYKLARAMFNDSRRLALTCRFSQIVDANHALSISKTFLLLEIYGFCSGDKRSFEFVEAFHINTLQAVERCIQLAAPLNREHECVIECLLILESYRAVLLQRPPVLPPKLISIFFDLQHSNTTNHLSDRRVLWRLFSPTAAVSTAIGDGLSSVTLAFVALFTFTVSQRGVSTSCPAAFWRPEFVELALDRWARAQKDLSGPLRMLYHAAHIRLHTNLALLQQLAMTRAHSEKSGDKETANEELTQWVASSDYVIARWHAESILAESKKTGLAVKDTSTVRPALNDSDPISQRVEPPLAPYCIYHATLVLWAGSLFASDAASAPEIHLHAGAAILAGMRVRVSGLLAKALREIMS